MGVLLIMNWDSFPIFPPDMTMFFAERNAVSTASVGTEGAGSTSKISANNIRESVDGKHFSTKDSSEQLHSSFSKYTFLVLKKDLISQSSDCIPGTPQATVWWGRASPGCQTGQCPKYKLISLLCVPHQGPLISAFPGSIVSSSFEVHLTSIYP